MTDRPTVKRPPLAVVILAAGLGTRMKSDAPKVLHEVCGRPMLAYVIDAALSISPERIVVVTGPDQDRIAEILPVGCERAVQVERNGTGDAVRAGLEPLAGFEGHVMVLYGDVPLVHGDFVAGLFQRHLDEDAAATLTTVRLDDPAHYGRIVRDADERLARIVEFKDAAADEREIEEINVGLYVFRSDALRPALARLGSDNSQGELYLTDVVHLLIDAEHTVAVFESDDEEMCMGVNSRVELALVNAAMRWRLLERLMLAGVTIEDPDTTFVDWGVEVGRDSFIRANTHLLGRTTVGAASEIGPGAYLSDAFIGDRARVVSSHLYECVISSGLQRRSVRLYPPQHGARRRRQGGHLRGDQEQPDRRGQQGAASQLRGRRRGGPEQQRRRRQHHRQLRRLRQARHDHRRPRAHRQSHHHRGAGHHRRRRLHRRRVGDHA